MTDADAAEIMREYAEQAVAQASKQHDILLDYTEQSLLRLDMLLSRLTNNSVRPLPPPDSEDEATLWLVAKAYGGYLGEVMRLHLGGSWHHQLVDSAHTVRMQVGDITCSPPERVWNRLTSDAHDTILSYYRGLQHLLGRPLFEPEFPKAPWWKRLLR